MNSTTIALPIPVQTKPKTRIQRTREQWKALVDEFATSGTTKAAFCKKHRIATSCLYRWQKVFAEQTVLAGFIDITQAGATPEPPAADNNKQWQVELELGAGIVLRLRSS